MSTKSKSPAKEKEKTKTANVAAKKVRGPGKKFTAAAPPLEVGEKEYVLVARVREPKIATYIYGMMADKERTMQDVIKGLILFGIKNGYSIERKESKTIQKQIEARKRKLDRYKALAGKDTDE